MLTTLCQVKEIISEIFESYKRDSKIRTEYELIEQLEGNIVYELEKLIAEEKKQTFECETQHEYTKELLNDCMDHVCEINS